MTNRMLQAVKTLERMVNQNIYDEISQGRWNLAIQSVFFCMYNVHKYCFPDYRYWDDPSDEYKEGEGSLLPLWKMSYEKTKKHDVTCVCFNSRYYDLFAVAYGSREYLHS